MCYALSCTPRVQPNLLGYATCSIKSKLISTCITNTEIPTTKVWEHYEYILLNITYRNQRRTNNSIRDLYLYATKLYRQEGSRGYQANGEK